MLIQQFPEGKRIISFSSRVFVKAERKMSTLHGVLCGIVSALQTYQHHIIVSPFPIYLYCDHKPLFISGDAKDNYHIAFSDMRWSLRNSKTSRSFVRQAETSPFQIFSAETLRSKNIKSTSCNTNAFRVILKFSTETPLRSDTKSNMKTTLTIPATTSTQ